MGIVLKFLRNGLVGLVLTTSWALAQNDRADQVSGVITFARSNLISSDATRSPHAESFLAQNPKNPAQMLATSIVFERGRNTAAVYVSKDRGRTWQRTNSFGPDVPSFDGGDPIVSYGSNGNAFFGSIGKEGFRLWRSGNPGLHWTSVVMVPGGLFDRQFLAVDTASKRFAGRLYATGAVVVRDMEGARRFAIGVTFSKDHGATFAPPTIVDTRSNEHNLPGVADGVVTTQGNFVLPFQTFRSDVNPHTHRQFWTIVSRDGGRSFSKAQPGPKIGRGSGFRSIKTHAVPRTTIDLSSGRFTNRIYITWVDFSQDRYDIKVAHTDDLGLTWSDPVKINDNSGPNDPSNPAIAVNREGVVAVIWNDRRDDPRNECYRLYASASLDGGDTFLPNVKVNTNPTCPSAPDNWPGTILSDLRENPNDATQYHSILIQGVPERFQNGGETQGLIADPDGRFHAAWINGESGVMQIWYTDFTVKPIQRKADISRVTRTEDSSIKTIDSDRTGDIGIEASEPLINFATKSLSFKVSLKNNSLSPIRCPLTLRLDQLDTKLGELKASNADNGQTRKGATWIFSQNDCRTFGPGEISKSRQLIWAFDGNIPAEPNNFRFRGQFRVFSEPEKVTKQTDARHKIR